MRSGKAWFFAKVLVIALVMTACGKNPQNPELSGGCLTANASCASATGSAIPTPSSSGVPLYIADPSTTGPWGYPNEPLVSVTVCSPNHTSSSQCQTISNVLLDTGSFGFRVFASALGNVQLAPQTVTVGGPAGETTLNLAECALFGSGTDWGSIQNADVLVGSQVAANIPIQVIDVNYNMMPRSCEDLCPDTDPCTSGFNGILGVGPFVQDCGAGCAQGDDQSNPGTYFGCDSTGCYDAFPGNCGGDGVCVIQVPTDEQVGNPVAHFSSGSNNGVSITLPQVDSSGAAAITGNLSLGIGSPSSVTVYPADPSGMSDGKGPDFSTTYDGMPYGSSGSGGSVSFLDTGSNGIFFPGSFSKCANGAGFFCPDSVTSLSATIAGYDGSPTGSAAFSIGNAANLFHSGMSAFDNVGGPASGMFDWGLPFFYGKTVYIGISGSSAAINGGSVNGPYWAF